MGTRTTTIARFVRWGRAAVGPFAILSGMLVWTSCGESPPDEPEALSQSDGLVFVRRVPAGGTDLFLARIADGAVRQLAETPEALESNPMWLPSVLRVLYVSRPSADPASSSRLMMRDPRGGNGVFAGEKTFLSESEATVSWDGRRIVFAFEAPVGVVPPLGIRVVSPMTGRDEVLGPVPNASAYLSPRFAPNGASVAVQAHRKNRGDDLWLLLAEGRRGPLTAHPRWNDQGPRFVSSGGAVFFTRSLYPPVSKPRAGRGEPAGGGDICRIHLATKQVTCPIESDDAREYGVEPSRTREEIVFARERDGSSDLFLAGLEGENERRLTDSPDRDERTPVWSPDGDRIAYVDGRGPQRRIVVIDREGTVLFETPGYQPGWAPPFPD